MYKYSSWGILATGIKAVTITKENTFRPSNCVGTIVTKPNLAKKIMPRPPPQVDCHSSSTKTNIMIKYARI